MSSVIRRRSPIDPPDGAWAVLGLGESGLAVWQALADRGLTVVGYDSRFDVPVQAVDLRDGEGTGTTRGSASVQLGHGVIDIEEIEDIDLLAVTSLDLRAGQMNTDYYMGIVVAADRLKGFADLCSDVGPTGPARLFPSENPTVLSLLPDALASSETNEAARVEAANLIAAYVALLAERPRLALSVHRALAGLHDSVLPTGLRERFEVTRSVADEVGQIRAATAVVDSLLRAVA